MHGAYNEKYIPGKWAFGLDDYMHDFLIIGCDEEKFVSVGYVADGRFKQFEIPNQNLIDGLYETDGIKINLSFFSYNKGVVPVPNIKRMIDNLQKYISTTNYLDNPTPQNNSYGISTNIRLRDFFEEEVKKYGKLYVDKRYSRVLYEHKWVLTQLIDSFLDKDEKREYQDITNKNLERAKLVHMLGLKMDYTGDGKLDGIDLKEYNVYAVRRVFGVLFQDYVTYCLPLREIIALSDFDERSNDEKLKRACDISGASEIIKDWEQGFDSVLGRYYADNGKDLSGGQWQLIGLARAYFKDSEFMILDEPSAALDPISENRIFKQLYNLSKNKSSITISHRLSNTTLADKIFVIDDGHIIEQGSHAELLKQNGKYAHLFGLQASKYI